MQAISSNVYSGQFKNLINEIGEKNYFNGEVRFDTDDYIHVLECVLIIYRKYDTDGAGQPYDHITDIVPIWWNERAFLTDGTDSTDFSWLEFSKYFSF